MYSEESTERAQPTNWPYSYKIKELDLNNTKNHISVQLWSSPIH